MLHPALNMLINNILPAYEAASVARNWQVLVTGVRLALLPHPRCSAVPRQVGGHPRALLMLPSFIRKRVCKRLWG
jgi:hypothetical protein